METPKKGKEESLRGDGSANGSGEGGLLVLFSCFSPYKATFMLVAMAIDAIHPGVHLAEELEALEMSAAELARKMNVSTNRITQILNGTRSVTGDTALRLAHFFGTSAQFWLNLQSLYDLRVAEEKNGKSIKALPRLKRREPVPA